MSEIIMRIMGVKPPDEKYKKMKAVFDACVEAGLAIDVMPEEVYDFFEGYPPREHKGVCVDLEKAECCKPFQVADSDFDQWAVGFEVEVAKIPKNVKLIRFYKEDS